MFVLRFANAWWERVRRIWCLRERERRGGGGVGGRRGGERRSGGSWSFLNPVVGSGVCCFYHFLCPFYLSLSFPHPFYLSLSPSIFTDPFPNSKPSPLHPPIYLKAVFLIFLSASLSPLSLNQLLVMAFGSVERRKKRKLCVFEGNVVWLEDTN